MDISLFDYELPEALIARYPTDQRSESRLLVAQSNQAFEHSQYKYLTDFLLPNDLLVFNNSRVINARLYGKKETGGQVEVMLERVVDATHALAQIKASKSPKVGQKIIITKDYVFEMIGRVGSFFQLELVVGDHMDQLMQKEGHVPLPPYIKRDDESCDMERYQTIYSKPEGSVAAPTAGLHFDEELMAKIDCYGGSKSLCDLACGFRHLSAGTNG